MSALKTTQELRATIVEAFSGAGHALPGYVDRALDELVHRANLADEVSVALAESRATTAALSDRLLWAEASERETSRVAAQRGDELTEARATIERLQAEQKVEAL